MLPQGVAELPTAGAFSDVSVEGPIHHQSTVNTALDDLGYNAPVNMVINFAPTMPGWSGWMLLPDEIRINGVASYYKPR
jgi:hypothetical protein